MMALLSAAKIPYIWQYQIIRWAEPMRSGGLKSYSVDFLVHPNLAVEVDGDAHTGEEEYDQKRDAHLTKRGYKVLRFSNKMVLHHGADVIRAIRIEMARQ
jgi:very-short-patch-repair endonuclease